MPAPVLWGDEETVRDRLREGIADLTLTRRMYHFEYPFPRDEVVAFYRANYGPLSRACAVLDVNGQEKLRSDLTSLWSAHNKAAGGLTKVDAEYLEVVAIRGSGTGDLPKTSTNHKMKSSMSRRAGLLASRIEEGAAALAAFVEGLSDADWSVPISPKDNRSVGSIVHHVASVYPIEIDLARTIAGGKAVTDVTWEIVADLNAKHAREHANVTKAAALELLRRNSREAAQAVRAFTDDELDRAAPFSLSYAAPVTAQFVIEDHALRHSWHHLARIRTALGR